jgi:hypothetical protein
MPSASVIRQDLRAAEVFAPTWLLRAGWGPRRCYIRRAHGPIYPMSSSSTRRACIHSATDFMATPAAASGVVSHCDLTGITIWTA